MTKKKSKQSNVPPDPCIHPELLAFFSSSLLSLYKVKEDRRKTDYFSGRKKREKGKKWVPVTRKWKDWQPIFQ